MLRKTTFIVLLLTISLPAQAQVLESDSLALVALYDSTDGANWTTTWDLDTPVGTWHGVTVSGGLVTWLYLWENNLVGTIPAELGSLANLTLLDIGFNQLSGSIPAELGNLANLTELYLYLNQLSGSIPAELGNLTSLTTLYLGSNQLSGSIPAELEGLANLQRLYLYSNQLSGSIPAELGDLASLTSLYLSSNQLSGSIPAELGNLANLTTLNLGSNQLSGSIPAELGNLANLTELYLHSNQFSGSIPAELEGLANLQRLYLYSNQLSGLPDLSTLTALNYLLVQNNRLTFEDLEPNMGVASTSFTYAPQDSVGNDSTIVWGLNGNLTLSIPVGGTANVYQWMKDGVDIPGATGDILGISPVAYADSGSYVLRITNTIVTGLILHTRPIMLKVVENLEPVLTAIPDTTIQEDDTLRIVLHGSDIYGDPLTYGAASDTSAVATIIEDSLLTIIPQSQWNGVASIFVSLSDGQMTVKDTFEVTVEPVNDPPEPFALLVPADGDTAEIVNDSLLFVWELSADIEDDSLTYIFHVEGPGYDSTITGLTDTALVLTGMTALAPDSLYTWYVDVLDGTDTTFCLAEYQFRMPSVLALDPLAFIPAAFALHQNYPNPFNPTTTIRFDLPMATDIFMVVYDLLGREVVRLVDGRLEAGYQVVVWNARDSRGRPVPSGLYFVRLFIPPSAGVTPGYTRTIKLVLLR